MKQPKTLANLTACHEIADKSTSAEPITPLSAPQDNASRWLLTGKVVSVKKPYFKHQHHAFHCPLIACNSTAISPLTKHANYSLLA